MRQRRPSKRVVQPSYRCQRPSTPCHIMCRDCDLRAKNHQAGIHAINDLGIDSLDFSTSPSPSTRRFGHQMPLERDQEVTEGKATTDNTSS